MNAEYERTKTFSVVSKLLPAFISRVSKAIVVSRKQSVAARVRALVPGFFSWLDVDQVVFF
jgi:hypothetical protein